MIASRYQQDFYDELVTGTGDIQLVAVAGSGKTLSLQEGVSRLSWGTQANTLMTAFNAHIRDELVERQRRGLIPHDVTIQTIHSFGMAALRQEFSPQDRGAWVDDRKYDRLCRLWWERAGKPRVWGAKDDLAAAQDATPKAVRLAMLTATDPTDLNSLINHYDLDITPYLSEQVSQAVSDVLGWGANGAPQKDGLGLTYHPRERISFDDMVCLPSALDIPVAQYDMIMVDEVQDTNRAQQNLLLRARAEGGRGVWVGDPNQSCYGFSGADLEAFNRLRAITDAKEMPLSISYRCGKRIVERAQQIVPAIEAWEGAPAGDVIDGFTERAILNMAKHHSKSGTLETMMILCRTNAPLVSAALWLLREGVPAQVRGRDIGQQIAATLEKVVAIEGFEFVMLPHFAEVFLARQTATLQKREGSEMQVAALRDRVESVIAVWQSVASNGACNVTEMQRYLRDLFNDDERTITLSSIHKAKGLEADIVCILRSYLLPHPMARREHELAQEANLEYIAITRARYSLYIN